MSFIVDMLFGSEPEQVGTAQSPGDSWLQGQLQQPIVNALNSLQYGNQAYQTRPAPQAPGVPDYNVTPYSAPQAPFSSPMDFLNRGEVNTAQNIFENMMSGGGFGSARGGVSGAGFGGAERMSADLATGAMGRYSQAQLPYDQMQMKQGQDIWGAQNNVWQTGINQANLGYIMGQIPAWQAGNQALAAPFNMLGMYPGTTGSPMVDPGQQGMVQGMAGPAAMGAMMGLFSDIRLKKNVKKIGLYKGMDVIEFEYIWGGGKKRGLIAQQVKEVVPSAVGNTSGYLYVNYALV